jgi:hypothetical protein
METKNIACIDHNQKGNYQGYGHSGKTKLHRKVFIETYGYSPPCVLHTCDNSRCINPEHLIAGTHNDNNKDRANKGRSAKYILSRRKITQEEADWIKSVYVPSKNSTKFNEFGVTNLARKFKVDPNTIYNIINERTHFANLMLGY